MHCQKLVGAKDIERIPNDSPCVTHKYGKTEPTVLRLFLVGVVVVPGRLIVEEGHLESFALRAPVFEPKLHVLGLEARELLAVGHAVELLGVLEDQVVRGVRVEREPLLQARYFGHRVYEGAVPLATLVRGQGHAETGARRRRGRMRESGDVLAHVHDAVAEHGVGHQRETGRQPLQAPARRPREHLRLHVGGHAQALRQRPDRGRRVVEAHLGVALGLLVLRVRHDAQLAVVLVRLQLVLLRLLLGFRLEKLRD